MAPKSKPLSRGPYDNKLSRLGESVDTLQKVGAAVVNLMSVKTSYIVAKDLLDYYGPQGVCRTCYGKCTGRCQNRPQQQSQEEFQLFRAAKQLENVEVQETKDLLDTVPVKQISAVQDDDSLQEYRHEGHIEQILLESQHKLAEVQAEHAALLKAREVAKSASDAMRASLKEREDKLEAFESSSQAPAELVAALRAATESERTADERLQNMANNLAAHLAKTHRVLSAHLESVVQHRDGLAQDLGQLGFSWSAKAGAGEGDGREEASQGLNTAMVFPWEGGPWKPEPWPEQRIPPLVEKKLVAQKTDELSALSELWAEAGIFGEDAESDGDGAEPPPNLSYRGPFLL